MAKVGILFTQIESSTDILGDVIQKEEEKKKNEFIPSMTDNQQASNGLPKIPELEEKEEKSSEIKPKENFEEIEEEEKKEGDESQDPKAETKPKDEEENVDDIQIVWENMEVARFITQRHIDSISLDDPEKLLLLKFLAKIKSRLGDLQCWREDFVSALEEFKDAIIILQRSEDPERSREISEAFSIKISF